MAVVIMEVVAVMVGGCGDDFGGRYDGDCGCGRGGSLVVAIVVTVAVVAVVVMVVVGGYEGHETDA